MTSIVVVIMSFITILIIPREAAMQLSENFDFGMYRHEFSHFFIS